MAIAGLLAILILSYRQTITAYPSAGGAYVVTMDNFGPRLAQVAGSALLVDYVLGELLPVGRRLSWELTLWGLLAGFLLGVATELLLVAAGG